MMKADTIALANGQEQTVYRGGEGPALLWLHSLSGVEADAPLLDALMESFSIIAPVAPGFTELKDLNDIRDTHDLTLHYDDVLQALDVVEPVLVAGHSFGAMIAAEYAAHYPSRVARLILISPIGLWNDAYPVADLFAVPYPEMANLLYANPGMLTGHIGAEATLADPESRDDEVEALVILARGMTTVAKFLWPIPDRGLGRRLYRITAPTTVIFGESDSFVSARYADDFTRGITSADSRIVPDAGHMVHLERPLEISELLRGILVA